MSKKWFVYLVLAVLALPTAFVVGLAGGAVLSLVTTPAHSQTPPEPAPPEILSDIRARVGILTSIPLNTPIAIDLSEVTVPGVSKELTKGVTLKAFTRYVEFEGKKIGQVVLSGVEKDGQQEPLPAEGYSSQFDLEIPSLDPSTDVVIKGDSTALVAALKKLSATPEQAAVEQVVTQDDNNGPQKQEVGSSASENQQAAAYQTPSAVAAPVELPEGISVTSAGCFIRPDILQKLAFVQNKTVTTKNGAVVSESECSDGNVSFPIQPSYTKCGDITDIDPAVRTATAQYLLYYVDTVGNAQDVGECTPDPEKVFPIKEAECRIFLDYANNKAIPQSSLVYVNNNNTETQVRGCQDSETKEAAVMLPTENGCTLRHDYGTSPGYSYQQETYTYEIDGIIYTAGGCADGETKYVHEKVYFDAANSLLCTAITDSDGKPSNLQSRIKIEVDNAPVYITPCTPDTAGTLTISSTTEGCTNPLTWEHDVLAGVSYGTERFYFVANGVEKPVTSCQKSATTYSHFVETVGWQPHDGGLYAFPLTTVYITPPTGRYDVAVGVVLSGATQMPYELTGTTERATGLPTYPYEDCNKYVAAEKYELWKRPDETTFEKAIGEGTPIGPDYSCTKTFSPNWNKVANGATTKSCSATRWNADANNHDGGMECWMWAFTCSATYEGTMYLTREDGAPVSSSQHRHGYSKGIGSSGYHLKWTGGECPATAPYVQQWGIDLGLL